MFCLVIVIVTTGFRALNSGCLPFSTLSILAYFSPDLSLLFCLVPLHTLSERIYENKHCGGISSTFKLKRLSFYSTVNANTTKVLPCCSFNTQHTHRKYTQCTRFEVKYVFLSREDRRNARIIISQCYSVWQSNEYLEIKSQRCLRTIMEMWRPMGPESIKEKAFTVQESSSKTDQHKKVGNAPQHALFSTHVCMW